MALKKFKMLRFCKGLFFLSLVFSIMLFSFLGFIKVKQSMLVNGSFCRVNDEIYYKFYTLGRIEDTILKNKTVNLVSEDNLYAYKGKLDFINSIEEYRLKEGDICMYSMRIDCEKDKNPTLSNDKSYYIVTESKTSLLDIVLKKVIS